MKEGKTMAVNTYKCSQCGFQEEYIESFSVSKELWHPEVCPKCGRGNLEKVFDMVGGHGGFDCVGQGFYINDYGKKAWKQKMNESDKAKVLSGKKNPY